MAKPKSAKEKSMIEPSTMGVRRRILILSLLVAVNIPSDLVIEDGNYVCVQITARGVSCYQSGLWIGRVGKEKSERNLREKKGNAANVDQG